MPSELQNLDTIFNSRMFRVPDYQRGYAWGGSQLVDFWDDLDRLDASRNHYTGQLTLETASDTEWKSWGDETWLIEGRGYRPFYVVDGQQRLTTAIILIKCILDRIPDNTQLAFSDKSLTRNASATRSGKCVINGLANVHRWEQTAQCKENQLVTIVPLPFRVRL